MSAGYGGAGQPGEGTNDMSQQGRHGGYEDPRRPEPPGHGGSGNNGHPGSQPPRATNPGDFSWLSGFGETIRAVEFPQLPGIKEGELGGTVIGGWLALITAIVRDLSELGVLTPDPTLLDGALDRMSGLVTKSSQQAAFKLNTKRAALMVDISPTLAGLISYANAVLAEAEGMYHGGIATPEVPPPPKGVGKGEERTKGGKAPCRCRFFGRIVGKAPIARSLEVPIEEVEERRLRGIRVLMEEELEALGVSLGGRS
eukprot:Skav231166  [mRNA]  locus=scaffold3252:294550:295317:+ [translate_table: standard]